MFVIFTRTGNSFEVKIEADSSDVTDYVQDDKPRTNIGTVLLIRLVICQCLSVIFTRTGNSFEVKIEADLRWSRPQS